MIQFFSKSFRVHKPCSFSEMLRTVPDLRLNFSFWKLRLLSALWRFEGKMKRKRSFLEAGSRGPVSTLISVSVIPQCCQMKTSPASTCAIKLFFSLRTTESVMNLRYILSDIWVTMRGVISSGNYKEVNLEKLINFTRINRSEPWMTQREAVAVTQFCKRKAKRLVAHCDRAFSALFIITSYSPSCWDA